MPYYPTLAEDVARAKEILAKGAASRDLQYITDMPEDVRALILRSGGGTIYGVDVFAAYKLLESFVEVIEAVDVKVCELVLRHQTMLKRADALDDAGDDA